MPCGECNACCKSSYFIHIRLVETQTLSKIPDALLFPAPGQPEGTKVLGYDEQGRCPMLVEDRCSIYDNRPLTCRFFDCRVFTATRLDAGDDDKALITRHIKRWQFNYSARQDYARHAAVTKAASFLKKHAASFPTGFIPTNMTQLAVLAIKVYDVFSDDTSQSSSFDAARIEAVMTAAKESDRLSK